jgi:NADPH-dependent glutamate synthase beta subunit-like oxidoreductase/NAD-dependent dihydropyrimidine dehydrogenase PreA subunit
MDSCNRIHLDGAVNVRQLERFVGDRGSAVVDRLGRRPEQVAVVGSGPGGLTAAYHLARFGYAVTVFDAAPELGGLLRTGIPAFRLPREVLDREIGRIESLGVAFVTGYPVDRMGLVRLAQDFDAVLVATGLQELRALRLGIGETDGVEQGIVFLDRVRGSDERLDGEDVVVVGGGNTAMDAARTALRLGAESVRVVYRRSRDEMPAIREEVDEALEEGVAIDFLTQPVGARSETAGNGAGPAFTVTCRRMELGEPDESGRRRPVEVPDSDFEVRCDRLLLALGQSPDLSVFPEGTEVREGDALLGVIEKPVYALGDLATNHGTVAGAIGSGRRAAFHVHNTFNDTGLEAEPAHPARRTDVEVWSDEVVRPESLRFHLFEREGPHEGPTVTMERRTHTFDEVHGGLTDPSEAKRCLSCGVCNDCDLCLTFCPEGVLKRVGPDLVFDYAYCKGCGICVTECPRNVIYMSQL